MTTRPYRFFAIRANGNNKVMCPARPPPSLLRAMQKVGEGGGVIHINTRLTSWYTLIRKTTLTCAWHIKFSFCCSFSAVEYISEIWLQTYFRLMMLAQLFWRTGGLDRGLPLGFGCDEDRISPQLEADLKAHQVLHKRVKTHKHTRACPHIAPGWWPRGTKPKMRTHWGVELPQRREEHRGEVRAVPQRPKWDLERRANKSLSEPGASGSDETVSRVRKRLLPGSVLRLVAAPSPLQSAPPRWPSAPLRSVFAPVLYARPSRSPRTKDSSLRTNLGRRIHRLCDRQFLFWRRHWEARDLLHLSIPWEESGRCLKNL